MCEGYCDTAKNDILGLNLSVDAPFSLIMLGSAHTVAGHVRRQNSHSRKMCDIFFSFSLFYFFLSREITQIISTHAEYVWAAVSL